MANEKSPFVGHTVEEVLASEASLFVIQVGSEVFSAKGSFVFSKKSASIYYNKVLREILEQLANGTPSQKRNASRILLNLKILPLRVQ